MPRYKVVDGERIQLTAEEETELDVRTENADLDMSSVRDQRNGWLRVSDWTRLDDATLGDHTAEEWATYRQELRDLLGAYSRVSDVVWPEDPPTAKVTRMVAAGNVAYGDSIDDGDTVEEAQAAYDAAYAATD